jgi:hypothetical protein
MNAPQKMKVNFYLDHPTHSYFEVILTPHKDTPHSIIARIIQKLYPPHLHSYSSLDPSFVHVHTGSVLDPHKTFSENRIISNASDDTCAIPDIRIRLRINVLPLSQMPPFPIPSSD